MFLRILYPRLRLSGQIRSDQAHGRFVTSERLLNINHSFPANIDRIVVWSTSSNSFTPQIIRRWSNHFWEVFYYYVLRKAHAHQLSLQMSGCCEKYRGVNAGLSFHVGWSVFMFHSYSVWCHPLRWEKMLARNWNLRVHVRGALMVRGQLFAKCELRYENVEGFRESLGGMLVLVGNIRSSANGRGLLSSWMLNVNWIDPTSCAVQSSFLLVTSFVNREVR